MTLRSLIFDAINSTNDLDTEIFILDQNNKPSHPAVLIRGDLDPSDPALDDLDPDKIYLTQENL